MRVLVLHSRYLSGPISGENRVVEDETALLRASGHEVTLFSPEPAGTEKILGRIGAASSSIWSRDAVRTIRGLLSETDPDVVHVHNLFPTLSPAVLRAVAPRPLVMTLHNYRLMCLPSTLLRDGHVCEDCVGRVPWPGVIHRCYRDSFSGSAVLATSLTLHRQAGSFDRVDLFVALNGFMRAKHVAAGISAERIRTRTNFVPEAHTRNGSGDYFLFLGRLSPEKGLEHLVHAMSDHPGRLVVAGDGPERSTLQGKAPPNVEVLGPVPPDDVPALLAHARAVLVPSVWYEGTPRVILEGYAAGVPAIVSRIGGLAEIVEEGVSGSLAAPGDVASWRSALTRLMDDRESMRLGEGAKRLWNERHTPEVGLRTLEDIYEEAIDHAAHRGKTG